MRPEDYYFKLIANLAFGNKPGDEVKDADAEEIETFRMSRSHLEKHVFDEDRWKKAIKPGRVE
ncbi:hypothetical protein KHA80_13840 [Anaerobacillus sp. HL2]|nr:hypothetical protein KHA80_13840 [Anaerobacillus sp. HL2]